MWFTIDDRGNWLVLLDSENSLVRAYRIKVGARLTNGQALCCAPSPRAVDQQRDEGAVHHGPCPPRRVMGSFNRGHRSEDGRLRIFFFGDRAKHVFH